MNKHFNKSLLFYCVLLFAFTINCYHTKVFNYKTISKKCDQFKWKVETRGKHYGINGEYGIDKEPFKIVITYRTKDTVLMKSLHVDSLYLKDIKADSIITNVYSPVFHLTGGTSDNYPLLMLSAIHDLYLPQNDVLLTIFYRISNQDINHFNAINVKLVYHVWHHYYNAFFDNAY